MDERFDWFARRPARGRQGIFEAEWENLRIKRRNDMAFHEDSSDKMNSSSRDKPKQPLAGLGDRSQQRFRPAGAIGETRMPSKSLHLWRTDRKPRLLEISNQCASSGGLIPPNPHLFEENIRGYILLLSAHFQGFCRDLYSECSQGIAVTVNAHIQTIVQQQFSENKKLDVGNPNIDHLKKDFSRFGCKLNMTAADPANHIYLAHLSELNKWRNIAAHQGIVPPSGLPSRQDVQTWENSCDGLATSLDRIMYNQITAILGTGPWVP